MSDTYAVHKGFHAFSGGKIIFVQERGRINEELVRPTIATRLED